MPPAQGPESQKWVGLRYSRAPRQADLRHPGLIPVWKAPLYSWPPRNQPAPWGQWGHLSCLGQGTSRAGPASDLTTRAAPERVPTARTGVPVSEGRVVMGTGWEEIPIQEGHS